MSDLAKVVYESGSMPKMCGEIKRDMVTAVIATVNIKAAKARKEAVKNVKENFITRRNFTIAQIQFTPMSDGFYSIDKIHSIVGVTEKAAYMARQETGGERTPARGSHLAIPTNVARGGNIRRPVESNKRISRIGKRRRVHGKSNRNYSSHAAWNVARAFVAYTEMLFLPLGGSGGRANLHQVVSFQILGSGDNQRVRFETQQVYRRDMESTITPANPWLLPASELVESESQAIFNSQMKKQGL
ncbi:MAG: hypothetical protein FWC97_00415 [Treponema sp.]|nr:hypothetical protein [Treponema sp.]